MYSILLMRRTSRSCRFWLLPDASLIADYHFDFGVSLFRTRCLRLTGYFDNEAIGQFDATPDIVAIDVTNDHTIANEAKPDWAREAAGEWNRPAVRADSHDPAIPWTRFVARRRNRHNSSDLGHEQADCV